MMMKEAVVAQGPKVTIHDVPMVKPGPYQVVTKVIYTGTNPKDWKFPEYMPNAKPVNQGDDIAGIVHEVGEHVSEFKPGDRSATTAHLPTHLSFQEGAAVPLAALTAAIGLFARLQLPPPFTPPSAAVNQSGIDASRQSIPLIIYGAASAVGSYAVQLASRANIHPLICVAGNGIAHVEKYIDRSKDTIIDYRDGNEAVVRRLKAAVDKHGGKVEYALDAVSETGSVENIAQVIDQQSGRVTFVLPGKTYDLPGNVEQSLTTVGSVHGEPDDLKDFGHVYLRYIAKGSTRDG